MTVQPLIIRNEDMGISIIDLNIPCPTVNVTTTPPPSGAGGGILLLLGVVALGIIMKGKK